MTNPAQGIPAETSGADQDSLVIEIVWHDNQWRGACNKPLANESCLDSRFYIWGDDTGKPETINANKPAVCGDPSRPGRCSESELFLNWRWPRWPAAAPSLGRKPPYILFVSRQLGDAQDQAFYFRGFYSVDHIEPDSQHPNSRTVYAIPERSSWFSPEVKIPLLDFFEPTNRMALKGKYIATIDARRVLEAELKAHQALLTDPKLSPGQRREIAMIGAKIESALGIPPVVDDIGHLAGLLRLKGQIVLAGPPGVGKTYQARRLASQVLGLNPDDDNARSQHQLGQILRQQPAMRDDPGQLAHAILSSVSPPGVWDIVQFHPSYAYEDFVRGIQAEATPESGAISFRPVNRTLGLLADLARELGPDVPVVLIVDEINRGDLAKVLGELIYALEYRNETVVTPYAVNGRLGLQISRNFYLIGTMNTADRAIALVDYAIRRRFSFVHLAPSREVVARHYTDTVLRSSALALFDQVQALFQDLGAGYVAEDLAIGHSYFLARDANELASKVAFEVAPLLIEYHKEGILTIPPALQLDEVEDLVEADPFKLEQRVRDWLGNGG